MCHDLSVSVAIWGKEVGERVGRTKPSGGFYLKKKKKIEAEISFSGIFFFFGGGLLSSGVEKH